MNLKEGLVGTFGIVKNHTQKRKASMTSSGLEQAILEQLSYLEFEQQRQVLDFVRALILARKRGVPGQDLLRFAGTLGAEDLATMAQAIEEGCEKADLNGHLSNSS